MGIVVGINSQYLNVSRACCRHFRQDGTNDLTRLAPRRAKQHKNGLTRLQDCRLKVSFAHGPKAGFRSEEHTSELQSLRHLVCRLLLEKKKIEYHKPSDCTVILLRRSCKNRSASQLPITSAKERSK